jgi:23S rRNA (guanosine2251-2'-O)-methyltransferase
MAAEVRATPATATAGPGLQAADPDLLVLLEDVQDPRNLGAVLRVCEGAGTGRVLIRDRGAAPVSPTVVKTSAGAAEWLSIERIPNTAQSLERLKDEGFWVYGTDAAGVPPWEVDLTGKVVLCFGGEEKGLRSRTRQICDRMIGLPMRGRVGSLNISTAAAAVLYEAVRQRGKI